ncbi:MAG: CopG family ribbon-helix-helix protein [Actinomycetota bacterium]
MTVSLPPELAREIDRVARSERRSRSEMFREALRQYLTRRDRWEKIFSYGHEAAGRSGVKEQDVAGIVTAARRARRAGPRSKCGSFSIPTS